MPKPMPKNVVDAMTQTFNSALVQRMTADEYQQYMTAIMALSMSAMRANEGDKFVADFVTAALSSPLEFMPQQAKKH